MTTGTTSTIQTDVLVVGYGPVGATIACLLGRHGVHALVVDKATDIYLAPRAIALDNEALRILQLAGLTEDAFEKIAIPQVRMHCPYVGEFARINTGGSVDGHPKLVTFYQPELERALRARVSDHTSIHTLLGAELLDFEQSASSVQARLKLPDGSQALVQAKYLLAADGASSQVRKAIGQEFGGQTYAEDWLIVDARNVPGAFDHIEFLCDPRRPTPHMVAPGERMRWEFMLQPGETREEMEKDETIHRLLARWATPAQLRIERKAVYRFHARSCERFSKGRVFLAGDAAHITPPFVGQGLVAGLRDAANLCWKLAWVLKGQAAPAILESYDQERRPHAKAMIVLAKFMGQMVMPRNALAAILVHGFMRALRMIPGVRNFVEELGIKPKNAFRRGLLVPGRKRLTRGACLPQGLVRTPGGPTVLSDEALGSALTLVGFGLDPASHLDVATLRDWQAAGGSVVQFCLRGQSLHRGANAFEDVGDSLVPKAAPYGWAAVVRPDRTVLHDGPVTEAARLVRESLAVLKALP